MFFFVEYLQINRGTDTKTIMTLMYCSEIKPWPDLLMRVNKMFLLTVKIKLADYILIGTKLSGHMYLEKVTCNTTETLLQHKQRLSVRPLNTILVTTVVTWSRMSSSTYCWVRTDFEETRTLSSFQLSGTIITCFNCINCHKKNAITEQVNLN